MHIISCLKKKYSERYSTEQGYLILYDVVVGGGDTIRTKMPQQVSNLLTSTVYLRLINDQIFEIYV
jgi:hypothetical protein